MPLHPGHLSTTQILERFRRSREGRQDLSLTITAVPAASQRDWDTLHERRDLDRLSMMYRIVHGLVDIPAESYLNPSTSTTRGHNSARSGLQTALTNRTFPDDHCTVEPTPSHCREPGNARGLPEPAGYPH